MQGAIAKQKKIFRSGKLYVLYIRNYFNLGILTLIWGTAAVPVLLHCELVR
jgi:hypothetical protein